MSAPLRSARPWLLLAVLPLINAGMCTTIREDRSVRCVIPGNHFCAYPTAGIVGYPCKCGEVRGRFGQ
jgi:hypothetical protein